LKSNLDSHISGGIGKAEGFADGGWANHRQAALAAATRRKADYRRAIPIADQDS
jgi:hypothetical protein